jgi:signal transduction histidine kinase
MDCLPVGVILWDINKGIKFVNREMLSNIDSEGPITTNQSVSYETDRKKISKETLLASLNSIAENSENGRTLKDAIERKEDIDINAQVYQMECERNKKVFEVKTIYLPQKTFKSIKIAIVKDQTIFEQLVKRKHQEKSQRMLLSSISHEIRNPLNAVGGFIAIIQESDNINEIKDSTQKIGYEMERIELIVTSACDLMMTENKLLILQPEEFVLEGLIYQVLNMFKHAIESKHLGVIITIDPDTPITICSDIKKYKQILFHLITNAVKYTTEGQINITINYDKNAKMLCTQVGDTGMGIDDKAKQKLFKLYANVDHANSYNPQGMGFGLTLCKKLCSILGGEISVISDIGKGSKFTFTIKSEEKKNTKKEFFIEEDGERRLQELEIFVPTRSGYKMNSTSDICKGEDALIVDDEALNRMILKTYLKSVGIKADEAENGAVAIERVKEKMGSSSHRYKVILMDINMPTMDGTEATESLIKIFSENPEIRAPIIAVTAANLQSRTDIQRLLSIGFCDICKNFF